MRGILPENQGNLQQETVANPAAGAGFVIPSYTGCRVRFVCARFRFVTDANVANRRVTVDISAGATSYCKAVSSGDHTASVTAYYSVWFGMNNGIGSWSGNFFIGLPNILYLDSDNMNLAVTADNIQVGDQFSNIYTLCEIWPSA